jgi:hypothetical protein
MGEHKFIKDPNGDGEKAPLSTHLVEVGDFSKDEAWGPSIEAMYTRLHQRAKDDDSLILSVVQTVNVTQEVQTRDNLFQPRLIVVLTAQRIGREELERQQRAIQIAGGPRR